eukprot:3578118-Pyramimonas_sp.AAC.1
MAEARSPAGQPPIPPSGPSVTAKPFFSGTGESATDDELPERLQFLIDAEKGYEAALQVNETDTEALYSWAQVLHEKATRFTQPYARSLYPCFCLA